MVELSSAEVVPVGKLGVGTLMLDALKRGVKRETALGVLTRVLALVGANLDWTEASEDAVETVAAQFIGAEDGLGCS